MSALVLTVNSSGNVTAATIDGNDVGPIVNVSQSLVRGNLQGSLTINFDSVTVNTSTVAAPTLGATFAADGTAGTTITVTDTVGSGNHFAYSVTPTAGATPNVGDNVTGTTNISGSTANIATTTAGTFVNVYELTGTNTAVKFVSHELLATEVGDGNAGRMGAAVGSAKVGSTKVGATNA